MKDTDVRVGEKYTLKVGANLVPVEVVRKLAGGGWEVKALKTLKILRVKDAERFIKRLGEAAPQAAPDADARSKGLPQATKDAKPMAKRRTGEQGATGAKRASGLDAAARVLAEAGEPMNCKAMVERALEKGYWKTTGKTPQATIYAAILREIQKKGNAARFRKTERGKFALAS